MKLSPEEVRLIQQLRELPASKLTVVVEKGKIRSMELKALRGEESLTESKAA